MQENLDSENLMQEIPKQEKLTNKTIIKSISFDEGEILQNIMKLYSPEGFEVDPCYSIGNFYKRFPIPQPKYKFDINPQTEDTVKASAEKLPFEDGIVKSIIFDPPFLAGENQEKKNSGIICTRFGQFKYIPILWEWYDECLQEFYRILKDGGVLVIKCQDTVSSSKQYLSHCTIMNFAVSYGFYPKDLFILLAKSRIIGGRHHKQQHSRKFHCYYMVFFKETNKVEYYFTKGAKNKTLINK